MSIFKSDKVPFFFTLLLGLFTWLISRSVDKLTSAPFVEYATYKSVYENLYTTKYVIKNISYNKSIDSIDFLIIPEVNSHAKIIGSTYQILPPLKMNVENFEDTGSTYYKFRVANFQPLCSIILSITTDRDVEAPLRFQSRSTVLLQKSNILTKLVRWEGRILFAAITLVGFMLLFYFIRIKNIMSA
jgi:hypothetical protein